MKFKENIALWLGLAIPVVMVLVVAVSIYWPQRGIQPPQHNFVYALRDYGDGYEYVVVDEKLVRREAPNTPKQFNEAPTRFFLHDVTSNTSQEMKFEEVQELKLDNSLVSADGYELKRGGQGGGVFPFFFDNSNYNEQYLVKGNHSVKLALKETQPPYYGNQMFLGWVVE
jgi:hypothetical protein